MVNRNVVELCSMNNGFYNIKLLIIQATAVRRFYCTELKNEEQLISSPVQILGRQKVLKWAFSPGFMLTAIANFGLGRLPCHFLLPLPSSLQQRKITLEIV